MLSIYEKEGFHLLRVSMETTNAINVTLVNLGYTYSVVTINLGYTYSVVTIKMIITIMLNYLDMVSVTTLNNISVSQSHIPLFII